MIRSAPEEIGARMDALGLWDLLTSCNFAVKPEGTAFPYFCTVIRGDGRPVKVRFLMLEGWQTLHDYVRTRCDRDFGFYSTPMEMAHLEMVVMADGKCSVFRHDPGYLPQPATEAQRALAARILWESYGLLMRMETDRSLPMRFAQDKAVFARVEVAAEKWEDRPLVIPDPPPHIEKVSFPKTTIKSAQDLPFVKDLALDVDFRLLPGVMTREARPRCVYELLAKVHGTDETVVQSRASVHPEAGLRGLWEMMPVQLLAEIVRWGKVPGEIRVMSGRVFRMLRPLCIELPFKLSLHDHLNP